MLTLGGDEEDSVKLSYFGGLNTQPYETINLTALQRAVEARV